MKNLQSLKKENNSEQNSGGKNKLASFGSATLLAMNGEGGHDTGRKEQGETSRHNKSSHPARECERGNFADQGEKSTR